MASSKLSRSNPSFSLPEDLIIDILSKLPVKSLIRFAVVCKAWYTLIQNPYFISKHLNQSIMNPNFNLKNLLVISHLSDVFSMSSYIKSAYNKPTSVCFPFMGRCCFAIVGVCNGLICVSLHEYDLNLVLCNPATMKFHEIPDCKFWTTDCIEHGEASLGFGFDPSSNDYKLIKIMRFKNKGEKLFEQAEIYSMSTNSWREVVTKIPFSNDVLTRVPYASATIDGVFYWEGQRGSFGDALIWSFDMRDQAYRVIEGPKCYQGMWGDLNWEFIQFKQELAIFVSTSKRCYNVWVLSQNGTCWNEKFRIGPFPSIERPIKITDTGNIKVAGFGEDGEIIIKDNTLWYDIKFFSYNLWSKEIKILRFAEKMYYFRVFWYTESLLPVKISDQAQQS